MTTRDSAPFGAPTWTDVWTSDVPAARRFYGELFGWESTEPVEEFGGYFNFARNGALVAGGMGDMPGMPANNSWKVYFATDDIDKTLAVAEAAGANVFSPAMAVGDLGKQAFLIDPTGAGFGVWQPGAFHGFTVLEEDGAPSWFDLQTRDHSAALAFYGSVFGWSVSGGSDTDEFRYSVMRGASGGADLAGIMDSRACLAEGEPPHWDVYWHVDDMSAAVARVRKLGGAVLFDPDATPYGELAVAADPMGARFKLRVPPGA